MASGRLPETREAYPLFFRIEIGFFMSSENDYIMLSALQHYAYCPRQCALIHIEQQWAENRFTVEGDILHERVDSGEAESRGEYYSVRTIRLQSKTLQITGVADLVEFRKDEKGVPIPGKKGLWQPCPVEYKRGTKKADDWDRIQLCAQAICLEEMLQCTVPRGALWYQKDKHREWVDLDEALRGKTQELAHAAYAFIMAGKTPKEEYLAKRCLRCSLLDICQPKLPGSRRERLYYEQIFKAE